MKSLRPRRVVEDGLFIKPVGLAFISNLLLRTGMLMPFVTLVAFFFDTLYLRARPAFGAKAFGILEFPFFRGQYSFLLTRTNTTTLMVDFRIFEMFIIVASVIGFLRVLTGICTRSVLDSYREKFQRIKSKGMSTSGLVATLLLIGPFAIICSTNFEFAARSSLARDLIAYSPRSFLCAESFVFCAGAIFSAEAFLFFLWFMLFRDNAESMT